MSKVRAGVLALQGDYAAHCAALALGGAEPFEVRSPEDIARADLFVLPGGESTVMGMLLQRFGMMDPLVARVKGGMPILGTCAGLILLAKDIEGRSQPGLALLDVAVRRNAYGTQVDSFRAPVATAVPGLPEIEAVFIRAPKIVRVGPGVEVLAEQSGDPILVRQGAIVAATFHPEIAGPDAARAFYRWFASIGRGTLA